MGAGEGSEVKGSRDLWNSGPPAGSDSIPTRNLTLWGASAFGSFMCGAEVGMWNSAVDTTPATQSLKFAVPTDPGFCSARVTTYCSLFSEPSQGLLTSNLPVLFHFSLLLPPFVFPSSLPSFLPPTPGQAAELGMEVLV